MVLVPADSSERRMSMIKINDRVSFVKNLVTITGTIVDIFDDDNGGVGIIIKDFNSGLHAVKESEIKGAK